MGNIVSIDLSPLIDRCLDCITGKALYVCKLEDNFEALKTAEQELKDLRDDVKRRIRNEEEPEMKPTKQVEGWLLRVQATLDEVDETIKDGDEEIKKLCLGCCSKNYRSSYVYGKIVAEKNATLMDLKNKGVFDNVVERVATESIYVRKVADDLQRLKTETDELKALKKDVMRRVNSEEGHHKKPLEQVQLWFSELEDTITEVDDLIQNSQQEIDKLRLGCSDSKFGNKVAKHLDDVVALKAKGKFQEVARNAPDLTVERNVESTGCQTMLNDVWTFLIEQEVRIIGIYGIGGVGKTTLLTQINNEFLNKPNDFDAVIWVTVSKDLKLEKIQEEIREKLGFNVDEDWKKKSMEKKAEDIFEVLSKKKFVLLLDDIRKRVDLKQVGIPLSKSHNRSRIVFTTRSEAICGQMGAEKKMKVEPLAWENAWKLFQETFGEELGEEIYLLAQNVAKECGGLPICLKTVARAMAGQRTPQEWNYALENLKRAGSSLFEVEEEVFAGLNGLKFSYDYLPNDNKPCFLYCALFPEDFKIYKDDLINYWICENYCGYGDGYKIVGNLVRNCLLEEDDEKYVKMHVVIRDMALWIASKHEKEEEKFLVHAGVRLHEAPEVGKWEGVKRISLLNNKIRKLKNVPTCRNLSTLLLGGNEYMTITSGFFQYMDSLAVLDLSGTCVSQEILMELSKLVSLQYLNLSNTDIVGLPPQFKMLGKLKYLNLENNLNLKKIPLQVIASLLSLQIVMMYNCGSEGMKLDGTIWSGKNVIVEELSRLIHLRTLTITIMGHMSTVQSFFNTPKLWSCTRRLLIKSVSGSTSLNISSLASMKHLERIDIWSTYDLEDLIVSSVMEGCYNNLQRVVLYECRALLDLTWLITLSPNLTHLRVSLCESMSELISVEKSREILAMGESFNPFANLKILQLYQLSSLESIYWDTLPFPFLQKVCVFDCPKLKRLPLNFNSAKGCQVIEGSKIWWDNLEWEDDATKAIFLPSFKPTFRRVAGLFYS